MAFFAGRNRRKQKEAGRERGIAAWAALLGAVGGVAATMVAVSAPARANTTGNETGLAGPGEVAFAMGLTNGYFGLNPYSTTGITYTNSLFGYIRNDYLGVVVGYDGTESIPGQNIAVSPPGGITHNLGGMITIGNQAGSLQYTADDKQALNGLSLFEAFDPTGTPIGDGLWPIPGWWQVGTGVVIFDYSTYLRARVDNANQTNIVGANVASTLTAPTYVNGKLTMKYLLLQGTTGPVYLVQEITLNRATARFHWQVQNLDSVAHIVDLRFNVPVRGSRSYTESLDLGLLVEDVGDHAGFYFVDPTRGVSNQSTDIRGATIPDEFTIYGRRADTVEKITDPPFAARFHFGTANGNLDATLPDEVLVTDASNLRPNAAPFSYDGSGSFPAGSTTTIAQDPNYSLVFGTGLTVAAYYKVAVAPGGVGDKVVYYGNGGPTENLKTDFSLGTEATEALGYNSAAANTAIDPATPADPAALIALEKTFLAPPISSGTGTTDTRFHVYGSIFNQPLANPLFSFNLTNVSMSLVLPTGLSLAVRPDTNVQDVSNRTIGTVPSDTDVIQNWWAQANGDVSGTLTYQITASTAELGSRTVTRSITVPATPIHAVTNAGYQIIGFPFQFDKVLSNNADPATVVNTLAPPAQKDSPALFFQWVPDANSVTGDAGRYQAVTSLAQGIGYFYKPTVTRSIIAYGAQPSAQQALPGDLSIAQLTAGQQQINLSRGWNIITNPYLYELPITYLRLVPLTNNQITTSTGSVNFQQAVTNGVISGNLFSYNPNTATYDFVDIATAALQPWTGYWIFVNQDTALIYSLPVQHNTVILPDASGQEPATRKGLIASGKALESTRTMDDWRLQLLARREAGKGDGATIIGVSKTVTATRASVPKPPAPVSDYVYVGLVGTDSKAPATRYAQILQNSSNSTSTWTVEVKSDQDGPVTMLWPNTGILPKRLSLSLKDATTGRTVALRSASNYQITLKANVPHRFTITAKERPSTPLKINYLTVAGNGRATNTGSAFDFTVGVSQDAQIDGRVLTIGGREVANFAAGRAVTAGATHLHWSGRAATGATLAAGVYQVEIVAKNDEGESEKHIQTFTTLR